MGGIFSLEHTRNGQRLYYLTYTTSGGWDRTNCYYQTKYALPKSDLESVVAQRGYDSKWVTYSPKWGPFGLFTDLPSHGSECIVTVDDTAQMPPKDIDD